MTSPVPALSAVTGAAIASAAAAAALGVVTARFLGPSGQGALTLVTTIVALVVVTLTLGTGASLRLRSGGKPTASDVGAFVGFSSAMTPIGAGITVLTIHVARPGLLNPNALMLSALLGATALAARQVCDLVQAYGRTAASIISLAVGSLVQAATFAALVIAGRASLSAALICAVLGSLVQIGFGLLAVKADYRPGLPNVRVAVWRDLVLVGAPTIGYSLGLLAMQRVDRLLLVAIAGTAAGGIYAVAATIAETARITSSAVGQLLFVRTAASRRVTGEVTGLYYGAILLQSVILVTLALAAPFIVQTFFGSAFSRAVGPVRGLLIAEFFMGIALMDSRILMGLGHLAEVGALTVAAVAVAVVLYAVVIQREGIDGAVLASVLIYGGFAVTILTRRVYHARRADWEAIDV